MLHFSKARAASVALSALGLFGLSHNLGQADIIRIASWNLNNLHFISGEALRPRAPARTDADFTILKQYQHRLNADVVAVQEVNGPQAARRVFPQTDYDLYFSGRYVEDKKTGRESDRIYTGFAVRKGVFATVTKADYEDLSRMHGQPGRPTRWGVQLKLQIESRSLYLLNVHLKSGCSRGNLNTPRSSSCETLGEQADPLERWIDTMQRLGVPFIVLGDFNRAFDVHKHRDHLWRRLDDDEPAGLDLYRIPFKTESECWLGTGLHYPEPVDFFVLNRVAWTGFRARSFTELNYDPIHRNATRRLPSDHCPILIEYDL